MVETEKTSWNKCSNCRHYTVCKLMENYKKAVEDVSKLELPNFVSLKIMCNEYNYEIS